MTLTDELLPMQIGNFAHNKRKNTIFRVLQGSAETLARRGGQCSYHCKANSFGMMCAKFCLNRTMFGKDIQKKNFGVFF